MAHAPKIVDVWFGDHLGEVVDQVRASQNGEREEHEIVIAASVELLCIAEALLRTRVEANFLGKK
eukprot:GAFH01005735.1.p2 GENE.GAFH01005735.1~~GAFH01005735.1.p2  ORF type:complete len:65 (-),score=13.09 GAFH01005735.1:374-568(-)